MSYKKLEVWQEARDLTILIHEMTLRLPKHEQFEEGQQIRRSIKSVRSNIVEGYGRRIYKQDYIRFIIIAQASNDETIDHLETLYETKSLESEEEFNFLRTRLNILGKKLNIFFKALARDHNVKYNAEEPSAEYLNSNPSDQFQGSRNLDPESGDQYQEPND